METIRDLIQPLKPVTASLPGPIRDLGLSLLGPNCYKTLVLDLDPTSAECLKLGVSKALGIGIIGASAVVKLPQLIKILNSKSGEGISFTGYALETYAYLITLCYSVRQQFPFSTYGETAFIGIQNVAISSLVLYYAKKETAALAFVMGLVTTGMMLFNEEAVPLSFLSTLQAAAGVLGVASKLPQILTNYNQGGTGQLSAFAVFNYLFGSLSRIFTTIQEVDDPLILYGFVAGFVLNAVLAGQMVYYWNSSASKKTSATKLEKPVQTPVVEIPAAKSSGASTSPKGPTTRRRG